MSLRCSPSIGNLNLGIFLFDFSSQLILRQSFRVPLARYLRLAIERRRFIQLNIAISPDPAIVRSPRTDPYPALSLALVGLSIRACPVVASAFGLLG